MRGKTSARLMCLPSEARRLIFPHSNLRLLEKYMKSVHLGAGFLLVFSAYGTVERMIPSLLATSGIYALIVLYGGFIISSFFATLIMGALGVRHDSLFPPFSFKSSRWQDHDCRRCLPIYRSAGRVHGVLSHLPYSLHRADASERLPASAFRLGPRRAECRTAVGSSGSSMQMS